MVGALGDEQFYDFCVAKLDGGEKSRLDVRTIGLVYFGSSVYQHNSNEKALTILGCDEGSHAPRIKKAQLGFGVAAKQDISTL